MSLIAFTLYPFASVLYTSTNGQKKLLYDTSLATDVSFPLLFDKALSQHPDAKNVITFDDMGSFTSIRSTKAFLWGLYFAGYRCYTVPYAHLYTDDTQAIHIRDASHVCILQTNTFLPLAQAQAYSIISLNTDHDSEQFLLDRLSRLYTCKTKQLLSFH